MAGIIKNIYSFWILLAILYEVAETEIAVLKDNIKIEEFTDVEMGYLRGELKGVIVTANPPDACSPIARPPTVNESLNWFVLIDENICNIGTKVIFAELAGYSAAVIYRLKENNIGVHRRIPGFYSNISAVLVRASAGMIIKQNYLYTIDESYRLVIYLNDTFETISFLSMMVAALAGLIVIIMVTFMIIKYMQRSPDGQSSRLSSRHLEQLPTSRFQIGDPYDTCAICLEDFKINDLLRILPCCHGYHANCIDQWLTENRRACPICKVQITFQGEPSEIHHSDYDHTLETTPLLHENYRREPGSSYRTLSNNRVASTNPSIPHEQIFCNNPANIAIETNSCPS